MSSLKRVEMNYIKIQMKSLKLVKRNQLSLLTTLIWLSQIQEYCNRNFKRKNSIWHCLNM